MLYPIPRWIVSTPVLSVPTTLENFPQPWKNGKQTLSLSNRQLVWAAITSGRIAPSGYIPASLQFSYSQFDMNNWRLSSCLGFVRPTNENGPTQLARSASTTYLETTERSQITYAVGSMMARAFCAFECDLPLMVHSKWLEKTHMIKYKDLKRPDYVAFDRFKNPVIVEAKGTKRKYDWDAAQTRLRTGDQVSAVTSVANTTPVRRIGCATLMPQKDAVELYCVDPEYEVEFLVPDFDRIVLSYYGAFSRGELERSALLRKCESSLAFETRNQESDFVNEEEHQAVTSESDALYAELVTPPELVELLQSLPGDNYFHELDSLRSELVRIYPERLIMPDLTLSLLTTID